MFTQILCPFLDLTVYTLLVDVYIVIFVSSFVYTAGLPCEDHSLCNGRNKLCIARGPAWPDNFRSNEIIAQRQADKARELFSSATEDVSGDPSKDC